MSIDTLTAPTAAPSPSDKPEDLDAILNRLAISTGVVEAPKVPGAREHTRVTTDVIKGSPAMIMEAAAQHPLIEDADERLATPDELEELETTDAKLENLKQHRARDLGRKALLVAGIIRNVGLKTYVADVAHTKADAIKAGYHNRINTFGDTLLNSMSSLDKQRESIRKQKEAADRLAKIKAQAIIDRTAQRRANKQ